MDPTSTTKKKRKASSKQQSQKQEGSAQPPAAKEVRIAEFDVEEYFTHTLTDAEQQPRSFTRVSRDDGYAMVDGVDGSGDFRELLDRHCDVLLATRRAEDSHKYRETFVKYAMNYAIMYARLHSLAPACFSVCVWRVGGPLGGCVSRLSDALGGRVCACVCGIGVETRSRRTRRA